MEDMFSSRERGKSSVPFTYCIDYSADHVGNPKFIEMIKAAPPTLLHVGSRDYPKPAILAADVTDADNWDKLITPAEIRREMERVRDYVDQLHKAGVSIVIPYICDYTIIGDHERRLGFWEFYDKWDEYEDLGFGPKPPVDPIEWMSQERYPRGSSYYRHVREMFRYSEYYGRFLYVYHPCLNNEYWREYLKSLTKLIARLGYDGVFVDNNCMSCFCPICQRKFKEYLRGKYTPGELQEQFGTSNVEDLELVEKPTPLYGEKEASPRDQQFERRIRWRLWAETQMFWSSSVSDILNIIKDAGEEVRKGFMLCANLGPMATLDGTLSRKADGKDVEEWSRGTTFLLYEEMQSPGVFAGKITYDYALQYKLALAAGVQPVNLAYLAQGIGPLNGDAYALACAEASAYGGGAFVQAAYSPSRSKDECISRFPVPELRNSYRQFFEEHKDLLYGFRSYADVGVVFFYKQLYYENPLHMVALYRICRSLMDGHIPFDFILESSFSDETLDKYKIIVLADVLYMSDEEISVVKSYVKNGGALVLIGENGSYRLNGIKREQAPFDDLQKGAKIQSTGISIGSYGKGDFVFGKLDYIVPRRIFELYELKESEINNLDTIRNKILEIKKQVGEAVLEIAPLVGYVKSLGGGQIIEVSEDLPHTLRLVPYIGGDEDSTIILHVINYDLPIESEEAVKVREVEKTEFDIRIPEGFKVESVLVYTPGKCNPEEIWWEQRDHAVKVILSQIGIYKVVRFSLRKT